MGALTVVRCSLHSVWTLRSYLVASRSSACLSAIGSDDDKIVRTGSGPCTPTFYTPPFGPRHEISAIALAHRKCLRQTTI